MNYKKFRTLQRNWSSNLADVIMSNLFFKLFIGYRFKPEQTTDCQLSVTTSFSDSSPAHLSDLTVYTPSRELRPRSGELRTQKLKSHLVRTQSSNVLPFKPGVGQYIAIHAMLTVREFFLAYFYPSSPFTCIFSKTSPDFSLCWLWLTLGFCVGP